MKKINLFLLTLGLTGYCFAQSFPRQKAVQLDELMKAYAGIGRFNGSVLVAKGNTIIYQNAFGYKNAAAGTKNENHTLFRIYSITKTFTSTLVFRLVEKGKISLDDRISRFYPSFPEGDSITVQHLLTHTSGIYDYTRGNDMKEESESSFMKFLSSKQLDFSPGKGWSYSNSNYWILGFIIEKVTGMKYEDAVKEYIFKPCGMKNSGFDFKTLRDKNKATGYDVFSDEEKAPSTDIDPPGPYAAGAIYSTVGDLYKYFTAHQSHELISIVSLEKAWTPNPLNPRYGFGWQLGEFEQKRMIFHGGGGPGFTSNFSFIPQDSICVILLINNRNTNLDALTRVILSVVYDKPYKKPFEIPVGVAVLAGYEGFYQVDSSFSLHVQVSGKRLIAQASGQGETALFAEESNLFYSPDADAYLEFVSDSIGVYNKMILRSMRDSRRKTGDRYIPTWGILGSATSVGWDGKKDLSLLEDRLHKGVWFIRGITLKKGVFKFRFNNDWNMNYGVNGNTMELGLNGGDISIEEGVYDLRLDISDPKKIRYSAIRSK